MEKSKVFELSEDCEIKVLENWGCISLELVSGNSETEICRSDMSQAGDLRAYQWRKPRTGGKPDGTKYGSYCICQPLSSAAALGGTG